MSGQEVLYREKETGLEYTLPELEERYRRDFSSYDAFHSFIEHHFVAHRTPVLSPYERTRNAVYATGNRWAIENFEATHS